MTRTLAAAALLLASLTTHASEPWDKTDKALFAGFTAVRAVDMAQTLEIASKPNEYREATNPFLGEHPSKTKVAGFFVLSHALIWLATDYMSPKARKIVLTSGIVIEAGFVGHNAHLGLRASF